MALNKGWDRHFFINNIMEEGRSLNVTKGQFAVVNNSAVPNKDGRKVISNFQGLPKNTRLEILQGIANDGEARTQSNKPWATNEFAIGEVQDLKVGVPSTDFEVDEFIVGYNGFDEETALHLENGENESLQISLSGEAIGMLNYKDATATFTFEVGKPNTGEMTDQEMIEELVLRMRRAEFQGGVPITKYVDIDVTNNENPAVGALTGTTDSKFFNLTVTDNGDSLGFSAVQAQYPEYKVVKTSRSGDDTTYTIVAPTATTLAAFEKFKRSRIKGCESCPAGFTEYEDGFVYSITVEDDGADSAVTIAGISPNVLAGGVEKVNQNDGVSYYAVVSSEELTEEEIDAFVDANESATLELASRDVQELCAPTNTETVAWTAGETCKATTEAYTMIIGDDECGTSRLPEVQAYYPDLTIVQDSAAQCAIKVSTSVVTNIVCEECSPAYRDLFTSDAPESFKGFEWKKAAKTYSATALMGIRLRGKKIELSGSEAYRDYMPFLASSVRLSVAGGYYGSQTSSYHEGSGERFNVDMRSRATMPEYLGGNLQELEEMSRRYFEDSSRQYQNAYGTWAKGEESLLNPTAPYVDYVLTVRTKTLSQAFSGELNETFYYHFITEVGKHQEVEAILNRLATEAGVAPVQAFGKKAV